MQVLGDKEANSKTVNVKIKSGEHLGKTGVIVGSNGRSMRYGRLYKVEIAGQVLEFSGSALEKIK